MTTAFAGAIQAAAGNPLPIIDTHIHLFDINRPQGVPWPPKDSTIYKSALPARYRKLAMPHGVVGAIEIECTSWLEDNQWVLDVAAKDPIIVGTVGDLEPGQPEFARQLDRFHRNPLFRGIRYGNLWGHDLSKQVMRAEFIRDLKLLASKGLVLDTANPDPALMHAAVQVSDRVPDLKIILDHLPELAVPADPAGRKACLSDLQRLGERPQVFAKVSGVVRKVNGRVPADIAFYRDRLDRIWELFGADRLLYGSDWPNSDQWASYAEVFRLAQAFIATRSQADREKFFWKNSVRAYGWVRRDRSQPTLVV